MLNLCRHTLKRTLSSIPKSNAKLSYTYEVNSLENFKNMNFNGNKNNKMIVKYGNNEYGNPIVYKIYYNSLSPIIVIKDDKTNYAQNLLFQIEKIENSKKIKNIPTKNFNINKNRDVYKEKIYRVISEEFQEIIKETEYSHNIIETECRFYVENKNLNDIKYNDFLIEFDKFKNDELITEVSDILKNKWKNNGLTLKELKELKYKRWKEYCENRDKLSPLEKLDYLLSK